MGFWGEPALCIKPSFAYMKQCKSGDINSFMMLFFDNFSSLIGILGAMVGAPLIACSFQDGSKTVPNGLYTYGQYYGAFNDMVFQTVCPGIGVALIFGNVWYWMMAAKLSTKTGRMDITALPYGINTPAGFLTVFMVMLPICFKYTPHFGSTLTPAEFANKACYAACSANFIGGLFEVAGIVIGNFVRNNTPRAALFGPICGVGFVWLGFNPLIDVMREPIIGMIPLFLTFTGFFSFGGKGCYPNMIPMALIIFVAGTVLWWIGGARWDTEGREFNENNKMQTILSNAASSYIGKLAPQPFVVLGGFADMTARAVAIQFPIALQSFLETIENVEAASLTGDTFNVNEAMLADGLGTMVGACFGAVMPTTVYIGHRRHKAIGATGTYSMINGIVYFILMWSGLTGFLFYLIDPVSIGCILIAVGLMIVQQACEASASRHYPCIMIAIMFVVADMLYFDQFNGVTEMATRSIGRMHGVANMAPAGGIICALVLPAFLCDVIDARFIRASIFGALACILSTFGLMHGNNYVFMDGSVMTKFAFTTDLGEVMASTFTIPTTHYFGFPLNQTHPAANSVNPTLNSANCFGIYCHDSINNQASGGTFGYAINEAAAQGGTGSSMWRWCNEGWRFAVAYAAVTFLCILHALFQKLKPGKLPSTDDNGKATTDNMGNPIVEGEEAAKTSSSAEA